jgi:predicted RNase H-like HicB family nuclease
MNTYDVTVTRDGRWWMVEIPELDGLTQARRLSEVEHMARDYIATWLDVALSTVKLGTVHIQVGAKDYAATRLELEALREEARRAEDAAARLARDTAKALAAEDVPVRDIGDVLGVSFQRASQLVNA